MAVLTMTDAFVSIGGTDLSDHVRSATLSYNADEVDATAMGDGARTIIPGFLDWSLDVEWNQDYASSKVDATLFPLIGAASASAIIVRPVKGTVVGPTNPNFTGNARLFTYQPVSGGVGELATTSTTFKGNGTLTRATA